MELWGLWFPSCHCYPFISVRGARTHTALTHTSCVTTAVWSQLTVSELWGRSVGACGCPPPLGLGGGVVLCLGTKCHMGAEA